MPAQPARKRQKVSDPAPAPTADDAMADSDEHAFEYEDDRSDDDELADSPAMALDSDDGHDELDSDGGGVDVLVLSDSDSDALANAPPEPEVTAKPKGKLTARKQFALDVQDVAARYAGTQDDIVKSALASSLFLGSMETLFNLLTRPSSDFKRDDGDEMIRFSLKHPKFPRGLKISLMFPELGGYPNGHEVMCFTEHEDLPEDVETVLPEVAQCVVAFSVSAFTLVAVSLSAHALVYVCTGYLRTPIAPSMASSSSSSTASCAASPTLGRMRRKTRTRTTTTTRTSSTLWELT